MIKLQNITQTYTTPEGKTFDALKNVSLEIRPGEIFGIIGRSGAGKSTLVRCINLLNRPTSGNVVVDGKVLTDLSEAELREARRSIGMIFQHFNLLSSRTVYRNIALPLELAGVPEGAGRSSASASRAPLRTTRRCFSPTKLPRPSTRKRRPPRLRFCSASTASSASRSS